MTTPAAQGGLPPTRRKLESWKEIAAHLGRGVRTVQRWEAEEGLPIHRQAHQSLGNVHAYADELDGWLAARCAPKSDPAVTPQAAPPEAAPPLRSPAMGGRTAARLALAALVLSAGAWWIARPGPRNSSQVTTVSRRALQLYQQGYTEITPVDWRVAEQFTREALAQDPQFASAHLWLAWALRGLLRPEEEWKAHLRRAVELSGQVTEHERLFVLASEKTMTGKDEQAEIAYRRLLAAHPEHFWGRNNLIQILRRSGRDFEMKIEMYRQAELHPNNIDLLGQTMRWAIRLGDLDVARKLRGQLLRLIAKEPAPIPGLLSAAEGRRKYVSAFYLHELWLSNRLEELREILDKTVNSGNLSPFDTGIVHTFNASLGRLQAAERITFNREAPFLDDRARPEAQALIAFLQEDPAKFRARLEETAAPYSNSTAFLFRIRSDSRPEQWRGSFSNMNALMPQAESWLAVLQGDLATADRRWADSHRGPLWKSPETNQVSSDFVVAVKLARAHELAGDEAGGLTILETADTGPVALFLPGTFSSAGAWHRLRYERARLLRKLGRRGAAEEIESGLKRDLRLADPEHPLATRLAGTERKPLAIY